MCIEIRDYQSKDAPEVKLIFREFVDYHSKLDSCFGKVKDHCDMFIEYMESSIKTGQSHAAVAIDNEKVVGYCFSKIEQKPPVYPVPSFGYIDNICVLELNQKSGIGTMLFKDAIEWFRKNDIKRVECSVAVKNKKSTSFWQKMGFKVLMEQMILNV